MDNGWIKIHRKMLDNPVVFKDPDHLAVWMYLLLNATHAEYKTLFGGKPLVLQPGQLVTGRKKIAAATKVNEYKVMRVLKLFENEQQIAQQTERYGSIISITSWDEYQDIAQQNEQQMHNDCTTTAQRLHTKQEYKEQKNIYIDIYKGVPEEIKEPFMEWVAMRAKIKKPVTSKITVTRALNRLDELADTTEEKIELIELAIERCWSSFYRPKEDKNEAARHTKPDERREPDDPGYYEWPASGFSRSS